MTSKVIVDAHAGWSIDVHIQNRLNGEWVTVETQVVPAMEKAEVYVYGDRRLIIEEGERP